MTLPLFLTFFAILAFISFCLGTTNFGGDICKRSVAVISVAVESKVVSIKFDTFTSFRRFSWIIDDCVVADSFNLLSSLNVSYWGYDDRDDTHLSALPQVPDTRNAFINLYNAHYHGTIIMNTITMKSEAIDFVLEKLNYFLFEANAEFEYQVIIYLEFKIMKSISKQLSLNWIFRQMRHRNFDRYSHQRNLLWWNSDLLHLEDFLLHNQSCSSLRSNDSKKDSFDICSNVNLKVRKMNTLNVLCNCRLKICPLGHECCMGILCSACDISTSNLPCNHPCCYKHGKEFSCCDAGDGPRQPKQTLASINEQARLQRKESHKSYRKRSSVVLGKGKGFSSCNAGDGPKKNNTVGGYRLISNDPYTLRKRNRNRDRMQRIRAASNMEAVP